MQIRPNFSSLVHQRCVENLVFFPTHICSQSITPAASVINIGDTFDLKGYSKTSSCPKLFGNGSYAFFSFLSLSAASEIIALALRSLSRYFKDQCDLLSTQPAYLTPMLTPASLPVCVCLLVQVHIAYS